jgi:2-keto-4-pentenoate hydratase/2-oxohepta-3-ene-1,7-dioic acid hydratase in catechol pathway
MRLSNVGGRGVLMVDDRGLDINAASDGRLPSDPNLLIEQWSALRKWAATAPKEDAVELSGVVGPPVPRPRQIFAVGLNYADHADEARMQLPEHPMIFTKFPSSLVGPSHDVCLRSATVDWEVELVVVMAAEVHDISAGQAWSAVAGLTIGQDLSDRHVQLRGANPQFSLGKSFPGFGPIGPTLVSLDEIEDPDDLDLGCSVNGLVVQSDRTSSMIFSVPELISRLSAVCTLFPGDVIFTGTPSGTAGGNAVPNYLKPGDELTSWIGGIGEMRNRMYADSAASLDDLVSATGND